jgi:hypothetical protein
MKKSLYILIISLFGVFFALTAQDTRVSGTLKLHPWVKLPVVMSTDIQGGMQSLGTATLSTDPANDLNILVPDYKRANGMVVSVADASTSKIRYFECEIVSVGQVTNTYWREVFVIRCWESSHDYKQGDFITFEGNFYVAKNDHVSGASFDITSWNNAGGKDGKYTVNELVLNDQPINGIAVANNLNLAPHIQGAGDGSADNETLATVGYLKNGFVPYSGNTVGDLDLGAYGLITSGLKVTDGAQSGWVLKSDADGNASWQAGNTHYMGTWDAQTNTPLLNDGDGAAGDYYLVSVDGTQFGRAFSAGGQAVYNGNTQIWEPVANSNSVASVNNLMGAVQINPTLEGNTLSLSGGTQSVDLSSANVITDIQDDLTEAVPYTGATKNVDLGGNSLTVNNIKIRGGNAQSGYVLKSDGDGNATWQSANTNYKGLWNASTNTPTLADRNGSAGDYYIVSTAGTALGRTFTTGGQAIYNGSVWEPVSIPSSITSVNSMTGAVQIKPALSGNYISLSGITDRVDISQSTVVKSLQTTVGSVTSGTLMGRVTTGTGKVEYLTPGQVKTLLNVETHPTGDGYLHVPATSTANAGKVLTAGATAGSISWIKPAIDVNFSGLSNGQSIKYDQISGKWKNATIIPTVGANNVDKDKVLTVGSNGIYGWLKPALDVNIDVASLAEGQLLKYDANDLKWINVAAAQALADPTSIAGGEVLTTAADGTLSWTAPALNVGISNLKTGQSLRYNGSKWENYAVIPSVAATIDKGKVLTAGSTAGSYSWVKPALDLNINAGSLADGHLLKYDANDLKWINVDVAQALADPTYIVGGEVLTAATDGTLSWTAPKLDVSLSSLSGGQSLKYNASTQKWENATMIPTVVANTDKGKVLTAGALAGSYSWVKPALDVNIDGATLANGQALKYDLASQKWINYTPGSLGGVAGTDYSVGTSTLITGILKSTSGTGALSIAVAADFPVLNQSTTGNAATATVLKTARTIFGNSFDGSANITAAISPQFGGTGLSTITSNNLMYGNGTSAVSLLSPHATTGALLMSTASGAPSWSLLSALPASAGALAVANGGTGQSSYTNGQLLIGNTTGNTLTKGTLTGVSQEILVSNGAGSISLGLDKTGTLTTNAYVANDYGFGTTGFIFEGSTADAYEGLLTVANPTADRTWTLPDASGTIALVGNTNAGAALTEVDDMNVTLTLGGSPSTSLLNATSLTIGWTGQLAVSRGGTGASSLTAGSYMVGNGTSAVSLKTPSAVLSDIGALPLAGGTLTGTLNLAAGTTTLAPLKLSTGANLTALTFGAVEFDGTNVYVTNNSATPTRKTLAYIDGAITGNAATATILKTARTINGVSFNGSANIVIFTEATDEFTVATASQTSFTLLHAPSAYSKVKMYINGVRISNTAYTVSGTTLSYISDNNGSNILAVGDRIQFDYSY